MIFDMSEEGNFEYLAALALLLQVLTLPLLWIGQTALGPRLHAETHRDMSKLVLQEHPQDFGASSAVATSRWSCAGRVRVAARAVGLRQDHDAAHDRGLHAADAGTIEMDGQAISSPSRRRAAEKRRMSMIFQSYAIWPNMTVGENVGFGLQVRKLAARRDRPRVDAILDVVQMRALKGRYPSELSGGQQQRVALARAIVVEPEVLLLDEPLSNLDANLREEMRFEIRRLHDEFKITTVYVTHDQSEAMVTSDRIVVMNKGRIEQIDRAAYRSMAGPEPVRGGLHRPHQFRRAGRRGRIPCAASAGDRPVPRARPSRATAPVWRGTNRDRPISASIWDYQVKPLARGQAVARLDRSQRDLPARPAGLAGDRSGRHGTVE
jgi:ABC-type nitrate/sulfonate/bicarbonate transport system ATPase subunit